MMGPRVFLSLLLAFYLVCLPSYPGAQSGAIGDILVEHVEFRDGEIRGVLRNTASHRVRDVELLIRYFWVWKAQNRPRTPGPELPFSYTVRQEIPPRGSIPFSYRTPPLPARADGYYDLEVKVARSVNVDSLRPSVSTERSGGSPDLKTSQDVARIVEIDGVIVKGPVVSGVLRNKAPHRIRDVELLIRHVWIPNNEYQPSQNDPGKSAYHTVRGEIQPGGSISFTHDSSPLASRTDGKFQTKVAVAGFVEVDPAKAQQDGDPPQIRVGKLIPTTQQGEAAAKLEATVEDPSGIQVVEVWLNGAKATSSEWKIAAGNRPRIQVARTFALPRFGDNCVALAATDTRGNSSVSKEVCLYRQPVAGRRQQGVVPRSPARAPDRRPTVAPEIASRDTRAQSDTMGPRIELLRPQPGEKIGVGSVRFEATLEDESGIDNVDVWLNDQKVPSRGIEQRGRRRITVERTLSVPRMGINCFGLSARDVRGNTSRERVCLVTQQQAVPGQASARVRSAAAVAGAKATPTVTVPPKVDSDRPARVEKVLEPSPDRSRGTTSAALKSQSVGRVGGKGQQVSMEKKIEMLKRYYLEEQITAKQFDRAVRTLEAGKSDRMLEDFINGEISVSTFRRAF